MVVDLFLAEGFLTFTLDDLTRRLRCSKSTLYTLGRSKDELVGNAVRRFFAGATARIEQQTASAVGAENRVVAYLTGVAVELAPATEGFMRDVAAHPTAREVYAQNTDAAAVRIRVLMDDGVSAGEFRRVPAAFVADVVASTMVRIQTGEIRRETGLADGDAYRELAALVLAGVRD